jgi:hypothetical protein
VNSKERWCARPCGIHGLCNMVQWDAVTSRELTWRLRIDQPSEGQELRACRNRAACQRAPLDKVIIQNVLSSELSVIIYHNLQTDRKF